MCALCKEFTVVLKSESCVYVTWGLLSDDGYRQGVQGVLMLEKHFSE